MDAATFVLVPVALGVYSYQVLRLAINRDSWCSSLGRAASCLSLAAVFYVEPTVDRWGQTFEAWAEGNVTIIGIACTVSIIAFFTYSAWLIRVELDDRRDEPEYLTVKLLTEQDHPTTLSAVVTDEARVNTPPYDWTINEVANWDEEPDWRLR